MLTMYNLLAHAKSELSCGYIEEGKVEERSSKREVMPGSFADGLW